MKKYYFVILLCFNLVVGYSQSENIENPAILKQFQNLYNTSQYDKIHASFSDFAKKNLPLNEMKDFLTKLNSSYGAIHKMELVGFKDNFDVYKTDFDKGVLCLYLALSDTKISGIYASPYDASKFPEIKRNVTPMQLPFKEEWTVFWGGDSRILNYHVVSNFQQNAFDIVINKEGKSYKTDGKKNEDYYCFGKEIIAPCDAEVVFAIDGIKDNVPGVMNTMFLLGNSILLKTKNEEYILLAHFKQNSLKVKQGDFIKQGKLLGLSGNSGNSSEPHLHFHIQNQESFDKAKGIKCYFDSIKVNGISKKNYSPIKGDKITNYF